MNDGKEIGRKIQLFVDGKFIRYVDVEFARFLCLFLEPKETEFNSSTLYLKYLPKEQYELAMG